MLHKKKPLNKIKQKHITYMSMLLNRATCIIGFFNKELFTYVNRV